MRRSSVSSSAIILAKANISDARCTSSCSQKTSARRRAPEANLVSIRRRHALRRLLEGAGGGGVGCLIKPDGAGVSKLMLELLEEVLHEPGQLGCALEHTQRRCEPPAPPPSMAKATRSWHSYGPRQVQLHHCDRCRHLIPLPEGYDRNRYVVGIAEFGADQDRGLGHQADEARIGFGHRGPSLNRRTVRTLQAQCPQRRE